MIIKILPYELAGWRILVIEIIAVAVASLFILAGLAGTLLPVLPGPLLIWLGMFFYGLIAGFNELGIQFYIFQALLAFSVMGVDYLFAALGSRLFGGSKAAFWGAAAGLLIGLFFFPYGLLLGPFLGAVIAELITRAKTGQAVRSGIGASLGFFGALPLKLALETIMILWFVIRII